MEVGCPGTWGLELLTPNPGSKSTPKACPTCNPATSPACHTQPQPKHTSHRTRSSMEIIITVMTNNNNNKNDSNNNNVIIKGERRVGENTITLRKLIKMQQTLSTVKTLTTCNNTRINCNNNRRPGAQETALQQAYYSNANPNKRKRHSKPPKTLINANAMPR